MHFKKKLLKKYQKNFENRGGGGNRHADIYSENFEFSTCQKCRKK